MSRNRVLERLHVSLFDSDRAPSPFHFERLEPRILLSADFLPGFSDQDLNDQDQSPDYSPDLQPLIAFLSSPLDKQTVKDSISLLPESLQLDVLKDTYRDDPGLQQISGSLIDNLSLLLAPDANDLDSRLEIIIVDSAIPDYQQLIDELQAGSDSTLYEVYVLDADSDGLHQITDILQEHQGVDAVHIISHGDDGSVKLGNTWLDASNLDDYAELITGWHQSFDASADLLIYGCNLATTTDGVSLIQRLGNLTGADVAVSDDLTGAASLGADWDLEISTGPIETNIPFNAAIQDNWEHVLLPPTVDLDFDDSSGAGGNDYATTFTENGGAIAVVDSDIGISDVDSTNIESATITLTNAQTGDVLAAGALPAGITVDGASTATNIILTGSAILVDYQTALQAVSFDNSSEDPNTTARTITVIVNDGTIDSAAATSTITVVAVNDEPTLTTTGTDTGFIGGGSPVSVFSGTSISTLESGQTITGLTITVSGVVPPNSGNEKLEIDGSTIILDNGESGSTNNFASYSVSRSGNTVTVVLSGGTLTASALETEVDNATYKHDDATPSGATRDVEITQLVDSGGTADGGDNTNDLSGQTSTLTKATNIPVVAAAGGTLVYSEDDGALVIDAALTVVDADDINIESATISITGGLVNTEDALAFVDGGGITGIYNGTTGVMTLTGTATLVAYESALESITYTNSNTIDPDTGNRTVTWVVNDGDTDSVGVTSTITVTQVNDAPTLIATGANPTYTEGGPAADLFSGITINPIEAGQTIDELKFEVTNVVDGSGANEFVVIDGGNVALSNANAGTTATNNYGYSVSLVGTTATVTLTTTGTSVANAQTLVDGLAYTNDSQDPTTANRVATLTSIKDSGGTVNGGVDSSNPGVISTVTFTAVNDAPVLTGDLTATVAEAGSYTILAADLGYTDPDDVDAGVLFTTSSASNGKIQVLGVDATTFTGTQLTAGQVSFVHDGSETITASFDVNVEDGNEDSSLPVNSAFNFTVTPVNDAPVLTGDLTATVTEAGSYTILAADLGYTDPDDVDAGVLFTTSSASNGKIQVLGVDATTFTGTQLTAGQVTFVHDGSETIAASFDVNVEDGNEDSSLPVNSPFNFTVTPVNDAPVLTGDLTATVAESGSYTILAADLGYTDPDDVDAGVLFTTSSASNGKIQVLGVDATTFTGTQLTAGQVTFVHDGSATIAASFDVNVEDGNEDISAPADSAFNFTVTPVNDPPVLTGDLTATVAESGSYTILAADLGYTDSDDVDAGVLFTTSSASNGKIQVGGIDALTFTGTQLTAGQVTFVHDGSATIAASFDVNVEDGNEDISAPADSTFNFTVTPVNDPPVLTGDLTATVNEAGTYTILAADLGYTDLDDVDAGVTFTTSSAVNGKIQVGGIDALTFTGTQLTAGQVTFVHDGSATIAASFDVNVEDGNEDISAPADSTFNFTVTPVNDPPVLTGDLTATVNEAGTYTILAADLGYTDLDDVDAGVTFTTSSAVNGKIQVGGIDALTFTGTQLTAGQVTFVHDGSATIAASFDVNVEDGNEDTSVPADSTFNFTVTPVNDPPVLTGDLTATVAEAGTHTILAGDLGYTDPDDVDAGVTFTTSSAVNGKIQVGGIDALTFTGTQLTAGQVTFVHDGSATIAASFDVNVEDGNEDVSVPGNSTFNFTVTPVNDAPVVAGAGATLGYAEGDGAQVIDNTLTLTDVDDTNIESARISITAGLVNTEDVLAFTNTASITGSYNATTGVLTLTGSDTVVNYEAALESITYTNTNTDNPDTGSRTVTWWVNDGDVNSADVTSTITVAAVNEAPSTSDNTVITSEDTTYTFTADDFNYSDVNSDALASIQITSLESVGALQLGGSDVTSNQVISKADIDAGNLTFVPVGNANGTSYDSFDFSVNDGTDDSIASATLNIDVIAVNDALAGSVVITGNAIQGQILTADTNGLADDDGLGPFNYQWQRNGVNIGGATAATYTQGNADVGSVITVSASFTDGGGTVESATSPPTAPVVNINDQPFATVDQRTIDEEGFIDESAGNGTLRNDFDPDVGDALRVIQISNGSDIADPEIAIAGTAGGSFVINVDGSFSFDPLEEFQDLAEGEQRTTQVSYTISDNQGSQANANLTVTVTGVNDSSIAVEDLGETDEDTVITDTTATSVLANDFDVDTGDQLQVSAVSNGVQIVAPGQSIEGDQGGVFIIQTDGTYIFDPGTDFQDLNTSETRSTQVSYTVSDGRGGSATTSLTVAVAGLSPTPLETPDLDVNVPDDSSDDEPLTPIDDETDDPVVDEVVDETTDEANDALEETLEDKDAASGDTTGGDESDETEASETPVSDDFTFSDVGTSEISIDAPETTIAFDAFELLDELEDDETEVRATDTMDRMRTEFSPYSDPGTLMTSQDFLRGLDGVREEVTIKVQAEQMVVGGGFALTTGLSVGYVIWLARSGILLSSLLTSLPAWQFMDPLPVLASMRDLDDGDDTDDESLESIVDGEESDSGNEPHSGVKETELENEPEGD